MVIENQADVTQAVEEAVSRVEDERLREILLALVRHLHGFVREVRLTEREFGEAVRIIATMGQKTTASFNVVEDPMERANLKVRRKDIYDRITAEWLEWNATMLPEIDASSTSNFTADQLADHIGTPATSHKADNPGSSPNPQ